MSPSQDPPTRHRNQCPTNRQKRPRRARRPRSRQCLLKGCEHSFRPTHPMARYCSDDCRQKARQWSQWKSRHRWRQSERGRRKRQQQSIRHRQRLRIVGRTVSAGGSERGSSQTRSSKNFFTWLVIVRAATRASNPAGARRCSDSAVTRAGAPWNGCWSENGDGSSVANGAVRGQERLRERPHLFGCERLIRSRHIAEPETFS
jgi:hypothetical protein